TIPTGNVVGPVIVSGTGVLSGSGIVTGSLTNNATILAGSGPGIETVNGNYVQGSTGTWNVRIQGANQGTPDFDQLIVNGTVTLAGTLSPSLLSGFTPVVGTTFKIIDNDGSDAVTGIFNGMLNGSTFITNGYRFQINYAGGTGNDVVLTA